MQSTTDAETARSIPTLASWDERLAKVNFAQLTADEISAVAPLLQMLCVNPPLRAAALASPW